jgi:Flp pilus assembly pilin Flp
LPAIKIATLGSQPEKTGKVYIMKQKRAISLRNLNFFADEGGATTTEYALLIVAIVLAVAATIYYLADFSGGGVTQKAFEQVGNQAGQFGKIQN